MRSYARFALRSRFREDRQRKIQCRCCEPARVLAGRAPARGWDLSRSTRVVGFEREERARRVGCVEAERGARQSRPSTRAAQLKLSIRDRVKCSTWAPE